MITVLSMNPAVDRIFFIDDFKPGGLFRVESPVRSAGGKGSNVARVAAMLGEEVTVLGFYGGTAGKWLVNELKGIGIETVFISVDGETRTNINIIDGKSSQETEILEYGPVINKSHITDFLKLFHSALETTSVLVCSGGLPDGVPASFYGEAIKIAGERGIRCILDTSGEVLTCGMKSNPYLIKPNMRELNFLTGGGVNTIPDVISSCRKLNGEGINIVAASLGSRGAILISREKAFLAAVPELVPVNTIGSGDSMVAGFAAAISQGRDEREMLTLGIACAAANTQFKEIGYISRELVEKYSEKVVIQEIGQADCY